MQKPADVTPENTTHPHIIYSSLGGVRTSGQSAELKITFSSPEGNIPGAKGEQQKEHNYRYH